MWAGKYLYVIVVINFGIFIVLCNFYFYVVGVRKDGVLCIFYVWCYWVEDYYVFIMWNGLDYQIFYIVIIVVDVEFDEGVFVKLSSFCCIGV